MTEKPGRSTQARARAHEERKGFFGMTPFGGTRIFVQANWPTEYYATRVKAIHSHPWVAWFERKLGKSTFICWGNFGEIHRECDPAIIGGDIFCGQRAYAEIKRQSA